MPPRLDFHPPLTNSASPWATDLASLRALLECPSTGAVTTRTSLLAGFEHEPRRHRFAFFDPAGCSTSGETHSVPEPDSVLDGYTYSVPDEDEDEGEGEGGGSGRDGGAREHTASVNTLGYSPIPLAGYLDMIRQLAAESATTSPSPSSPSSSSSSSKTIIVSVTGGPEDVRACYEAVASLASELSSSPGRHHHRRRLSLAVEINLSCPNIPGHPPPAYDAASLRSYVAALPPSPSVPVGVKTPPYTHAGQFRTLVDVLGEGGAGARLSFVTATNTLGSCLLLADAGASSESGPMRPALPAGDSGGIGGMAGPPLHPLALGNVATIRRLLDEAGLDHVAIVGVGGVSDGAGYRRMRAAGASMVGVGTALGKEGVDVFAKIESHLGSQW